MIVKINETFSLLMGFIVSFVSIINIIPGIAISLIRKQIND